MSYRILGVDPGSRYAGWAVIDLPSFGMAFHIVSCGLIDAGKEVFPSNLEKIFSELNAVIKEYSPSLMSLESIFSGVNPSSLIKLSQARGVICLLASLCKIELKEYPARFVKKSIAGYGNADKKQVREALNFICCSQASNGKSGDIRAFLESAPDENITDALAVAICCATDMGNFIKR